MNTKIIYCDMCNLHSYQDQKYGLGNRVYNRTASAEGKVFRCSVCSKERNVGGDVEDSKKKGKRK